jgi:hypothetical protein
MLTELTTIVPPRAPRSPARSPPLLCAPDAAPAAPDADAPPDESPPMPAPPENWPVTET